MADDELRGGLDLSALFLPLERIPQMLNYSDPATQQALISSLMSGAQLPNQQSANAGGWGYASPMDQSGGMTGMDPRMQMMGLPQQTPMQQQPGQPPPSAPQTMPW